MRVKPLIAVILLASLPAPCAALDEPERVRASELASRSFVARGLKITLKRFWAGSLLSRGYIEVRVENPSDRAVTFNPQRLSFVGKNGRQVNVRGRRQTGPVDPGERAIDVAQPREVAPRAYVKELYELDGRVSLPARFLYEGEELALVVK
jgi:hypothetical protein